MEKDDDNIMKDQNKMETSVTYCSADGHTTVFGYFYTVPEGREPKAIVQISHGMQEYIQRYRSLAYYLAEQGYIVCGNDHLGHGQTSGDSGNDGWFAERCGDRYVLEDLHRMTAIAKVQYPGLPCYLFGHSMGSFFARWYASVYPEELDGLIISGTSGPNPMSGMGLALVKLLRRIKGGKYRSPFVEKLMFGGYCKDIPDAATGKEWVMRDPDGLAAYITDPKCTFAFTLDAYRDLITVLQRVNQPEWSESISKNLPILLLSGDADPVGDYGNGVTAVRDMLVQAGVKDVTMHLYPGCRHEVHNDLQEYRELFYNELLSWLNQHVKGGMAV
jgi:alpha-beta hydrolase superfamily lysophospholipase